MSELLCERCGYPQSWHLHDDADNVPPTDSACKFRCIELTREEEIRQGLEDGKSHNPLYVVIPRGYVQSLLSELEGARGEVHEMEERFGLPHDDDPLLMPIVNSGTFKPRDPEADKARHGGTIGDWMRRAQAAESELSNLRTLKAETDDLIERGITYLTPLEGNDD